MIERKFVKQEITKFQVEKYVESVIGKRAISKIRILKIPLGERITIYTAFPGLVVGKKGAKISELTEGLKKKYGLENPQIEIEEIKDPNLDAKVIAEMVAASLERFGINKFKQICHKAMTDVMNSGARGVEMLIGGKVPGERARSWRFYSGYLKKCGEISIRGVDTAYSESQTKTGTTGVVVKIMPPWTKLPDDITINKEIVMEEVKVIPEEPKKGKNKSKQPFSTSSKKVDQKESGEKKPREKKKKEEVKQEQPTENNPKPAQQSKSVSEANQNNDQNIAHVHDEEAK